MRSGLAGAAAALMMGMTGAAAQPADYLLAYKAFSEAREAGNTELAISKAEQAWRLGEDNGQVDEETLAILAQNFANSVVWTEPERALAPLDRAAALANAGYGVSNMAPDELRLLRAYARLEVDPSDRGHRGAMHEAALAYAEADRPADVLGTKALINAALRLYQEGDAQEAYDLATIQARALERVENSPASLLVNTDLLRIAAMLSDDRRWRSPFGGRPEVRPAFERRLRDAHVLIDHAAARFEPAATLDALDPLALTTNAWHAVLTSLESTFGVEPDPAWEFEGKTLLEEGPELLSRRGPGGEEIDCGAEVEWEKRRLRYPSAATRRGLNGGVLIGYDLAADGSVSNARVLAEVPADEFGPTLLKQVEGWRADSTSVPDACRTDMMTTAIFTMRP